MVWIFSTIKFFLYSRKIKKVLILKGFNFKTQIQQKSHTEHLFKQWILNRILKISTCNVERYLNSFMKDSIASSFFFLKRSANNTDKAQFPRILSHLVLPIKFYFSTQKVNSFFLCVNVFSVKQKEWNSYLCGSNNFSNFMIAF